MSEGSFVTPEGWERTTLGTLGTYQNGRAFKTSEWSKVGRPIIRIQDLTGSNRNPNYFEGDVEERYVVRSGDFLISWSGTLGAYIWDGPEGVLNQHIFKVHSNIDKRFHYHLVRERIAELERNAHGSGMVHVTKTVFESTPVAFPPDVVLQRRIASLIDEADDSYGSATQHLATARRAVERFKRSVLISACTGRLTEDWRNTHPHSRSDDLIADLAERRSQANHKPPVAIAEQNLADLPESWSWVSVDCLSRAVVDGVHKTPTYIAEGIPFVTVRNLTAGSGISFESCKFISLADHAQFTSRTKPEMGDLLISKDGTIGVTRAIRTDREFSIFVSVAMVKPLLYEMSDYLELAFQSPLVQAQMTGVGSGLVHLVLRDLKADGIPVPPLEEQDEIVRRSQAMIRFADDLLLRIDSADTKVELGVQATLAKAFRGDLVPADWLP